MWHSSWSYYIIHIKLISQDSGKVRSTLCYILTYALLRINTVWLYHRLQFLNLENFHRRMDMTWESYDHKLDSYFILCFAFKICNITITHLATTDLREYDFWNLVLLLWSQRIWFLLTVSCTFYLRIWFLLTLSYTSDLREYDFW